MPRVIDLNDLAVHVEPSARSHGQPNGQALVENLLDLVGLSPTALARDLAGSAAGQELLAAGRASAFGDVFASIVPKLDPTQIAGLSALVASNAVAGAGIDFSKLTGLDKIVQGFQPVHFRWAR